MALRRDFIFKLGTCITITLSGCGTLLHSERIGRPHSNDIDWKVAALDGLGLILFFVPGVIAFVVDFSNGSIYLPDGGAQTAGRKDPPQALKKVELVEGELSPKQLQLAVSEQVGYPVPLLADSTRVSKLNSLSAFHGQQGKHNRNVDFGIPLRTFFAKLKLS